ncbi:S1/P1 nuclease [Luteimonas sp. BDR2-5]|uniref:S1/P1 nuclease n=1 Tax=Proluteimonas luteida TaxID=2878685 RepID=UPI001E2E8C55|nr:S1/P1 nuclease [Luteimonas sp. BDR2-5]MCD9028853.1 S1/P1 nuclease [Luteimonas sp. BDR2-5]
MHRFVLACGLAFVFFPAAAFAWGGMGHRLVAELAEQDLTPAARAEVDRLLAGECAPARQPPGTAGDAPVEGCNPTLAGIASWADELREHDPDLGRRSARWHYVNIGESACVYDAARDCPGGDCVVEAIREQAAILGDTARSDAERRQALKFVVHFVGDAHQPMHAGYAHDKGGNTKQINHRDRGSNLHAFWDSGMLNSTRRTQAQWLARLQSRQPAVADATVLPPQSQAWAEHACRIVLQPGVYPPRARIGDDYVAAHLPTVEQQLRDAGARLGALLNATLDPTPAP